MSQAPHQGTGKYEGMTWDGHRWIAPDPETGAPVKQNVTAFSRQTRGQKIFTVVFVWLIVMIGSAWYLWATSLEFRLTVYDVCDSVQPVNERFHCSTLRLEDIYGQRIGAP